MFNPYKQNKSLKKVLNGNFPEKDVKKMNRKHLENFVLKLVECSSDVGANSAKSFRGLYRGLCLKQINKPEWWPSEKIIEQSLTSDGKYFMELLRFLVYKCCEYFKKPCESLNNKIFVNDNDENCRGVKRRCNETNNDVLSKRRTLMPKNSTQPESLAPTNVDHNTIKTPVIRLENIFYKLKPSPLTQELFLNMFGLQNTFSHFVEEPQVPVVNTTTIKFNSCSVIPFSSDLGRELLKRDNHTFPEFLKIRRLERLEWYVNKQPPPRHSDMKYEITYQERKELTFRNYKFPRRHIWQHPGDVEYQKKKYFCRPLKVILFRENLDEIRQKINCKCQRELKVVISRMPVDFIYQSTRCKVQKK